MRRRLSLVVVFVGVLGLLALTPVAQGHDEVKSSGEHEGEPTAPEPQIGAVCTMWGGINIGNHAGTGGVSTLAKHHNHYRLVSGFTVYCQAIDPDMWGYNHRFEVDAAGATDGPWNLEGTHHGEDDARGWSHGDCYDGSCEFDTHRWTGMRDIYDGTNTNDGAHCTNCGEITVESVDAGGYKDGDKHLTDSDNVVMFNRTGSGVTAWGILHPDDGTASVCFLAELEFTPTEMYHDSHADHGGGFHTEQAFLTGDAQIWYGDKSCGIDNHGGKE